MDMHEIIKLLEEKIENPREGLPEDVFLLISRLTPMINVDLLIKDEKGRVLLSWRDDRYCGKGWHIPGGIIRFKEKAIERIEKVALNEIGTKVEFEEKPIAINELMLNENTRGHFISFLYKCFLPSSFIPDNKELKEDDVGYLKWHDCCPENFLEVQKIYKKFI